MSCKNDIFLAYLHHLVHIILSKACGTSLDQNTVVEGLVKQRLVLDKIKPLEAKLRYQIQKLVTKADNAHHPDDNGTDLLSFKPNPEALVSVRQRERSASVEGGNVPADADDGIYRPPRLSAVPYPSANENKKARRKDRSGDLQKTATSRLLAELSNAITAETPYSETTSGLSIAKDGASSFRKARKLDEMQAYEEENFTRLPMSKKDARQRRIDEEEVALGGGAAATDLNSARRKRAQVGFGAEMDELLDAIDRSGKKRAGVMQRVGGDEYEALRQMRRDKSAIEDDETVRTPGLSRGKNNKRKGGFEASMDKSTKRAKRKQSRA